MKDVAVNAAQFLAARDAADVRVLARMITLAENDPRAAYRALELMPAQSSESHVLGITGPPGVGKSSLVNRMVTDLRSRSMSVAVLAIDPSSPYSGGALLGDRIRMNEHSGDPGVYIRSMATRGVLGGLSHTAWLTVRVLQTWGFDWVIIETAGVGQNEIDIVDLADTTALVVSPGLGDEVQVMKAGVMEVADLFVINKSDLSGADRVHNALQAILSRVPTSDEDGEAGTPPIICETVATAPFPESGIRELVDTLAERFASISKSGELQTRRQARYFTEVRRAAIALLSPQIDSAIDGLGGDSDLLSDAHRVVKRLVTDEVWRTIDVEKD